MRTNIKVKRAQSAAVPSAQEEQTNIHKGNINREEPFAAFMIKSLKNYFTLDDISSHLCIPRRLLNKILVSRKEPEPALFTRILRFYCYIQINTLRSQKNKNENTIRINAISTRYSEI